MPEASKPTAKSKSLTHPPAPPPSRTEFAISLTAQTSANRPQKPVTPSATTTKPPFDVPTSTSVNFPIFSRQVTHPATWVEAQEKKKLPKGRAMKRLKYTRRFVNVTMTGGKRKMNPNPGN
ncbi:hypothetical protein BJX62DRAFT_235174 [Aspergillus germanicus]